MKTISKFFVAAAVGLCLLGGAPNAQGQDASHYDTATSTDGSDWGLLGLLGLIGLLGLKKKKSTQDVYIRRNPDGPA